MTFDYSKLRGRIRELGMTQSSVSSAVGIANATFSCKLHGITDFRSEEIYKIAGLLGIEKADIPAYFFTVKNLV